MFISGLYIKANLLVMLIALLTGSALGQTTHPENNFTPNRLVEKAKNIDLLSGNTISDKNVGQNNSVYPEASLNTNNISEIINSHFPAPMWAYTIMKLQRGGTKMRTVDYDNDGKMEIICTSNQGDYFIWFALEYNQASGNYEFEFISELLSGTATSAHIIDITGDGVKEIIIGTEENKFYFINGITKDTYYVLDINTLTSSSSWGLDIEFGDANNDNVNELVICSDYRILLFNPVDMSLLAKIEETASECRLGNVDADNNIEIVTKSGKVLEYKNGTLVTEWIFFDDALNGNKLLLLDVDDDGMDEIIFNNPFNDIDVFDADTKQRKYSLNIDETILSIITADVNNDGKSEIVYSDPMGNIQCLKAIDGTLLWNYYETSYSAFQLSVCDTDNDGLQEICRLMDRNDDYLIRINDLTSFSLEWENPDDATGPFVAVKTSDVDNDGIKEIVAMTEASYGNSILHYMYVFNGTTFELEWRSSKDFFKHLDDGGYDFEIENIDNDPQPEIIYGADYIYGAAIYVIDGVTKELQGFKVYDNMSTHFMAIETGDFNNDGTLEILAETQFNYYIINPDDLSITYTSPYQSPSTCIAKVANINSTPGLELVQVNGGVLTVYDLSNQSLLFQDNGPFSTVTTFDINNDNIEEIIAGKNNGAIKIIDGSNFQLLKHFGVTQNAIDGISLCNFVNTPYPEVIFAAGGKIYLYTDNNEFINSEILSNFVGRYNSIVIDDVNDDNIPELIVGTGNQIQVYDQRIYACMLFGSEKVVENVSCSGDTDGSVTMYPSGGVEPYQYLWNTGNNTQAINSLQSGTYSVIVFDAIGCQFADTSIVRQSVIKAQYSASDVSCNPGNNGVAEVVVTEGTAPFIYTWNTGDTTSRIENLTQGIYTLTVMDSKDCSLNHAFIISAPEAININILTTPDDPNTTTGEGTATAQVSGGVPPFLIFWEPPLNQTGNSIVNLNSGEYIVTVTDSNNCVTSMNFGISTAYGIDENEEDENFRIFPNPVTTGKIVIELADQNLKIDSYSIFNSQGKLIDQSNKPCFSGGRLILDVQNLSTGVYFVLCHYNNKTAKFKIQVLR